MEFKCLLLFLGFFLLFLLLSCFLFVVVCSKFETISAEHGFTEARCARNIILQVLVRVRHVF